MLNPDSTSSAHNSTDRRTGTSTDWRSFCERLDQGDSRAMRELFEQYSEQLIRLAGQNIHPALIRRFDGEHVVQSVFRTFFRRQREGEFRIE